MLGRVFEGVMDPAERRASGSYYTPAALVREIVRAGLEAVLVHRLGPAPAVAAGWVHRGGARGVGHGPRGVPVPEPGGGWGAGLGGSLRGAAPPGRAARGGGARRGRRGRGRARPGVVSGGGGGAGAARGGADRGGEGPRPVRPPARAHGRRARLAAAAAREPA